MNIFLALFIVFGVFAIGNIIDVKTNALISMILVAAVVFFIGFRTGILPATIFDDSGLTAVSSFGTALAMVHIGTTIKLRDFLKEWKTVVLALACTVVMSIGIYLIGSVIIEKTFAVAGAPIVAGGMVACLVMQEAVNAMGRPEVAVFCTIIIVVQSLIGIPITSVLLRKVAYKLRGGFRGGENLLTAKTEIDDKKLIPQIPEKYNSNNLIIAKVALTALAASYISQWTGISTLVWGLILGIILTEIGFLDRNALITANIFTLLMAAMLTSIFGGLAAADFSTLRAVALPLVVVMVIGVAICFLVSLLMGKLLGFDGKLSICMGLSALYGFPSSFLLSEEVSSAVGETEEERNYLMSYISPKLIIAGIVQMSIVSGIVAGFMTELL